MTEIARPSVQTVARAVQRRCWNKTTSSPIRLPTAQIIAPMITKGNILTQSDHIDLRGSATANCATVAP